MDKSARLKMFDDQQREVGVVQSFVNGARVLRSLNIDGVVYKRGATLTREQLLGMKPENFRACVGNRFFELT